VAEEVKGTVQTKTIEVFGRGYQIRMGYNAIRRCEEVLRMTIHEIGYTMLSGQAGLRELGVVFWAALETARVHEKTRINPWTLEEVGDEIDKFGSEAFFTIVYPQVLEAFMDAFPRARAKAQEALGIADKVKEPDPQPASDSSGTSS
jgi:hypothetical protein